MGLLKELITNDKGTTTISLNRTRSLSPKQLRILSSLSRESAETYVMSLLGVRKGRVMDLSIQREVKNRSLTKVYGEAIGYRGANKKAKLVAKTDKLATKHRGSIVQMFRDLLDTTHSHRPTNSGVGNWIGVEIECFIPRDSNDDTEYCSCDTDDDGNDIGTCCSSSPEQARNNLARKIELSKIVRCTVKDDGSLSSDDGYSCEVCILLSPANGLEPLRKLCNLLNDLGCYVNDTCGLHVHLDARHLTVDGVKLIGKRLGATLPVLASMVPAKRRNNTYCKLVVGKLSDRHDDRYCAINLQAYTKFKTIEVRLHSSTTSYQKIANWIQILKVIANTPIKGSCESLQEFIDKVPMPEKLIEYMDKRISKFEPVISCEDVLGVNAMAPNADEIFIISSTPRANDVTDIASDAIVGLSAYISGTDIRIDNIAPPTPESEAERLWTITYASMPSATIYSISTPNNTMTVMPTNGSNDDDGVSF